jgi:methionine-rich copper-binding protein CopC
MTVVALRIGRILATALALSLVWLVSWCAPALAHAQLVEAEPSADEALAEGPDRVRLRFNEPVDAAFDPLNVYDSRGERVDEDDARADPEDARAVEAGLEEGLPEGTYTVEYRVTSIDGHVVEGTYDFAVGADRPGNPGDAAPADGGGGEQPEAQEEQAEADSPVHYLHLVALGIGAVVFLAFALLRRR